MSIEVIVSGILSALSEQSKVECIILVKDFFSFIVQRHFNKHF